jgi:plastocyanin
MRIRRSAVVLLRPRGVALGVLAVFAVLASAGAALAKDDRTVFVMDRCEADSFNAVIGEGTCVRNGGVTFDNFARRLNPQDGGHNAWRFSRHDVTLDAGQTLTAINTGGETHTFTEVANFGAGIVPQLNAALPAGTPPAQPVGPLSFLPAGQSLQVAPLAPGEHRFECLIHPWMRMVVEQAN